MSDAYYLFFYLVKERSNHGYVEEKLKTSLSARFQDLEDRTEVVEHARSYFGEEMYRKFIDIDQMRNDALFLEGKNQTLMYIAETILPNF